MGPVLLSSLYHNEVITGITAHPMSTALLNARGEQGLHVFLVYHATETSWSLE